MDTVQPTNRPNFSHAGVDRRVADWGVPGRLEILAQNVWMRAARRSVINRNMAVGRFWLAAVSGLVIALLLRLPALFDGLWYDEAFTMWLVGLDLPHLVRATAGDVHPPLWYLVEWQSARVLGAYPWALRLPALLFGLLSIPLAGAVFDRFYLPVAQKRLALLLMTVSPFLLYYSAEARMYSLLLFVVLAAVHAAQYQNWLLFGLFIGVGLLTHNLMALYIIPLSVLWLKIGGRRPALSLPNGSAVRPEPAEWVGGRWSAVGCLFLAGATTLLIYAPWLPVALGQLRAVQSAFWVLPLSPGRAVYLLYVVIAGQGAAVGEAGVLALAVVIYALLIVGAYRLRRRWEILLLAFGPLLVGALISAAVKPILIPRVLIGSAPFLLLVVSYGAVWLYRKTGWLTLAGGAAAILLAVGGFLINPRRPDYAARYSRVPVTAGDTCYHLTPSSLILARPYLLQCNHTLWPQANNLEQTLTAETKQAMGMSQLPFDDLPPGRVWVFHNAGPFSAPAEFTELTRVTGSAPERVLEDNGVIRASVWEVNR